MNAGLDIKAISLKNKRPSRHLRGVDLERAGQLIGNCDTPFMILRTPLVSRNLERLRGAIPRAEVFYAVKANNHPAIIETLHRENCRFDISSANELSQVIEQGVNPADTVHTNPIKSRVEFDRAIELGARLFVADNPFELEKFARYGDKAGVLLRFKTESRGAVVNLSYKFGADPADIAQLLDRIIELGLNFRGFCFHVGSQCSDIKLFTESIQAASRLITLARAKGLVTEILDIGGGYPIEYTSGIPSIERIGRSITAALKKHIDPSIRVICEPGRFISGEAATLFASVVGKNIRDGIKWYYIDDGLYGSFSGRLFDHCNYRILTNRNTKWEKAVLAGPTCDSFDVIYDNCLMPPLEIDDVLIFPAMGAYCSVSASNFNGLNQAKIIPVNW